MKPTRIVFLLLLCLHSFACMRWFMVGCSDGANEDSFEIAKLRMCVQKRIEEKRREERERAIALRILYRVSFEFQGKDRGRTPHNSISMEFIARLGRQHVCADEPSLKCVDCATQTPAALTQTFRLSMFFSLCVYPTHTHSRR